jgi:hypothetical protein
MIEIVNKFLVSTHEGRVQILFPPRTPMPPDDAVLLAAWLVALADPMQERFPEVLDKVLNS